MMRSMYHVKCSARQDKTDFKNDPWLTEMVRHKPTKVAAVALANKNARTVWKILASGETYRQPTPAMA